MFLCATDSYVELTLLHLPEVFFLLYIILELLVLQLGLYTEFVPSGFWY